MFFYFFLFANTVILSILPSCICVTYAICKAFKVPFYNENDFEPNIEKIKDNIVPVYFGALYMVLTTLQTIDKTQHSLFHTLFNIVLYSIFVEGFYYAYHRIMHEKPFYKSIHHLHHTKRIVYPLDAFYFSAFDLSCYMACLHLPSYFIHASYFEYLIILYFYITMGFVSHSEIAYKHHILHHKYYKYNFCLVYPIFDMIFDTYKDSSSVSVKELKDTDELEFINVGDETETKKTN